MSNNYDVHTSLYIEDYFINSGFPLQCLDNILVLGERLSTLLSSDMWLSVIDHLKTCKMFTSKNIKIYIVLFYFIF